MGALAAGAGYLPLFHAGRFVAQQLAHRGRSGLMHRSPHCHLDRFEVETASLAAVLKDDAEQPAYFVFDFPLNRFRRFFSWAVNASSTGLAWQIFSFTSSRLWLRSRNR
jgi:hypothetical protein